MLTLFKPKFQIEISIFYDKECVILATLFAWLNDDIYGLSFDAYDFFFLMYYRIKDSAP